MDASQRVAVVLRAAIDVDLQHGWAGSWRTCEVTPWTVIKRWHDEGSYTPYGESELAQLLAEVRGHVAELVVHADLT